MDKYCKKILKYLNKHSSKDKPLTSFALYKKLNYDTETIDKSLELLKNNNKIVAKIIQYDEEDIYSQNLVYYSINMGIDYFKIEFRKLFFKCIRFLILNIICPLLVAYLTVRITTNNTIANNDCCNYTNNARNE